MLAHGIALLQEPNFILVEPYSRSEKVSRKRGMVLARKGQNVQIFIDLEYTARRTLTIIGCSKTMMMTNPKPYREWKTFYREGTLVLKTLNLKRRWVLSNPIP